MGKASGVYTDTLVFTMVGNPAPRVYLQDLTTEQCKSLELEKQYLYYDRRDDKAYTIARLADNNCWMTSNLRLGNEEGGAAIMLTSQDTNLAPGTTFELPASAGGVWASSSTDQSGIETAHVYYGDSTWVADDLTSVDQANNIKEQSVDGVPSTPAKYIGNYYNWRAATVGTGTYNNTTTNVMYDICPKGWRLPSGGTNGEFSNLITTYGVDNSATSSIVLRSAPFNHILSGVYKGDTAITDGLGHLGSYWSSTPRSSQHAVYNMRVDYNAVYNPDSTMKYRGLSVRCIYQPTIEGLDSEISYMQDMTDEICKATPTPLATDNVVPQATLIDMRGKDGSGTVANPVNDKTSSNYQSYIVRKLADGNCWMVQNLNMTLSTSITLTSDTTDIGYGYSQNALGTGHNTTNTSTTSGRTSWTPNNSTQTVEGVGDWPPDGSDGAKSFSPGDIYYKDGVGTGDYDSVTGSYSSGQSSNGDPWYHVGNFYNWHAATAGTGTATMGGNGYDQVATDSICPKGWRLPTNYGDKSYINLVNGVYELLNNDAVSANRTLYPPLNFVRSGVFHWIFREHRQKGSGYLAWSNTATANNVQAAYQFYARSFENTNNATNGELHKGHGISIRCVHRAGDITDLDFLQDISTQLCDVTAIGVATELVDKRDGKNYSIKKLADGKCWMTANLQLGSGTALTLTPALSDVSVNFSLPVAPTTISRWGSSDSYAASTLQLYDSQNDDYGVYYNWYTATAETGTYTMTSGTANSSICPRGWKLPISDTSSNDFLDLYNAYSDISDFMSEGNWGVLSGYYHNAGAINEIGERGYWLSSTPFTTSQGVFLLSTTALDVSPRYSFGRHFGYPVRCLVKQKNIHYPTSVSRRICLITHNLY